MLCESTTITHGHLFCGIGGGARGYNHGQAKVGLHAAVFKCVGGIDCDPGAVKGFEERTGVPGTVLDLFTREQYTAFHGKAPLPGWREATPDDVRGVFGEKTPDILFLSAPCQGLSGLISNSTSQLPKYQALNQLTVRGMWLALEAYRGDLPPLIIFENVPRIQNRGKPLLDQIKGMLESYGYAISTRTHDCGEIGHLAQSRKRLLLVARNPEKVPYFLHEVPKMPLRAVGEFLGRMPYPGDPQAGRMHRIPELSFLTWLRLALIPAGMDHRYLQKLEVLDGIVQGLRIVPGNWHGGVLGVIPWDKNAPTISGRTSPTNGAYSVQDVRVANAHPRSVQYGVKRWDDHAAAITGQYGPGQGPNSIADPRIKGPNCPYNNVLRVAPYDEPAVAVTAAHGSGACVQDVRLPEDAGRHATKFRIEKWAGPTHTVTGSDRVGSGAMCIQDVRSGIDTAQYTTAGHYGVAAWDKPSGAIIARAHHDRGPWSVADPNHDNPFVLPGAKDRGVWMIIALDGAWHRPFTTLELAVLQGLITPEECFLGWELPGKSDSAWRKWIGNCVPSPAAAAIAGAMGRSLLCARHGYQVESASFTPVWVEAFINDVVGDSYEVQGHGDQGD